MLSHAETTTAMLTKKIWCNCLCTYAIQTLQVEELNFSTAYAEFDKCQQLVNFQIKKIYY
jgi:hypothetical protein